VHTIAQIYLARTASPASPSVFSLALPLEATASLMVHLLIPDGSDSGSQRFFLAFLPAPAREGSFCEEHTPIMPPAKAYAASVHTVRTTSSHRPYVTPLAHISSTGDLIHNEVDTPPENSVGQIRLDVLLISSLQTRIPKPLAPAFLYSLARRHTHPYRCRCRYCYCCLQPQVQDIENAGSRWPSSMLKSSPSAFSTRSRGYQDAHVPCPAC
jgi:hypothetical protein